MKDTHHLLGGKVTFSQNETGYRAGIDAVFLAAAVPAKAGQKVLDLGCGAGAASLCLLARIPEASVTGVEIQPELAAMAEHNAAQNKANLSVLRDDIRNLESHFKQAQFDHVIANPPYLRADRHQMSPNESKSIADGETDAVLKDWIVAARRMLKARGTFSIVQRADRMDEIIALMHKTFGDMVIRPLWSKEGEPAKRVVITARLGAKTPCRLTPGIILHDGERKYTLEARQILEQGDSF